MEEKDGPFRKKMYLSGKDAYSFAELEVKIEEKMAEILIFLSISSKIDGRIPHSHMMVLYTLRELMGQDCKSYLEIGVHNGGSMAAAMQSKHECKFYGVDMFQEVLNAILIGIGTIGRPKSKKNA